MSPASTGDPDERLGAYADALADGSAVDLPSGGVGDDDARRAAAVAAAFGAVIDVGAGEVVAALAESGDEEALPPPELPDDYELQEEIGRGGMGVVYRAYQASLERTVAVKVLRPGDLLFGNAIRRFTQEARALAKLQHRNIVTVHEVGHVRGKVYYTMDLIRGRDLSKILRDGPLSPAHAVRLMRQVASAIAYTHAHGLVHRDLKPANILVDEDGDACVTDFGLAMELGGGDQLTLTGQILGTPAYMSPEQARGDSSAVGEATDVYALGALLYECLTGYVPFERSSPVDQIHAVIHDDPPRPRKLMRSVPVDLETICMKALEKRVEDRYATARAFLEDLERWESGLPIRASAAGPARRLSRWTARHRAPIMSATAASLVAVLVFGFVVVPFLARDTSTLVTAADKLLEEDRYDAANSLYTAALERQGDVRIDDALLSSLIEARVQVARATGDEGRAEIGRDLLLATRDLGLVGREQRTWIDGAYLEWEAALVMAEWPDDAGASDTAYDDLVHKLALASIGAGNDNWSDANALILGRLDAIDTTPVRNYQVRHALTVLLSQGASAWPDVHDWIMAEHEGRLERLLLAAEAAFDPDSKLAMHHLRDLRSTCAVVLTPDTFPVLAKRAESRAAGGLRQRLAAHLLAWAADIPVGWVVSPSTAQDLLRESFDPATVVRAWRELEPLGPVEGYQRRLELCIEERDHAARWPVELPPDKRAAAAPRTAHQDLTIWFSQHAGVPLADAWRVIPDGAEAWWAEAQNADPRDALVDALELSERPTPETASDVLRGRRGHVHRFPWLHNLLLLTLPPGAGVNAMGTPSDGRVETRWLEQLARGERSYRLRSARAEYVGGAWRLVPGSGELRDVIPGEQLEFSTEYTVETPTDLRFGFTPPGMIASRAGQELVRHTSSVAFGWNDESLGLDIPRVRTNTSSGFTQHSGDRAEAGFVFSPDHDMGTSGSPDRGRNSLTLALVEPRDAPDAEWTLAEWRTSIARDFGRLADLADSMTPKYAFHNRFQYPLWEACTIATYLPVPEAVGSMTRLAMRAPSHFELTDQMLQLARLQSGDASVLGDEHFVRAAQSGFDDAAELTIAEGGKYWARMIAMTDDDTIRAFAARPDVLRTLSADVATDLLEAVEGGADVPEPVADRACELAASAAAMGRVADRDPALVVMALIALALVAIALFGTVVLRGGRRLVFAALLVTAGLFMMSAYVPIGSFDLLHDSAGALLAAVGVFVLRRHADGRAGTVVLVAFLVAAAAALFSARLPHAVAGVAAMLAVTAIVVLGRDLMPAYPPASDEPRRPARVSRFSLFVQSVAIALLGAVVAMALLQGAVLYAALLVAFVAVPIAIAAHGLRASEGARGSALPLGFVLCYLVPLAIAYGAAAIHAIFGLEFAWQVGGMEATAVLAALTLSAVWAAFRLVGSARARAAYPRDAATGD